MSKILFFKWRPIIAFFGMLVCTHLRAENTSNFYTKLRVDAGGGIAGKVEKPLFMTIALERDRVSSYKGAVEEGGLRFVFKGLPTGKYDLVLVTRDDRVLEGLYLGDSPSEVTGDLYSRFEERVKAADSFFNKFQIQRFGVIENGSKILAFIERMRDRPTLTQSGRQLEGAVRRLEIAQFDRASDTWSFLVNRHLYREEEAPGKNQFLRSRFLPQLSGVRVIESMKDIGVVAVAE
jgi:hypothetical protein